MAEVRADHWMPLYVADYLKDTTHLSTIEHGAYFLLLLHAWTHDGMLPLDEKRIARIGGMTPREWRSSGDTILAFFTVSPEGYRHNRVDKELLKAGNMIDQRRAAGKASAAARAVQRERQRSGNGRSTGVATETLRNSRPSPTQEEVPLDKESNGHSPEIPDPEKIMFDSGVALLCGAGKPEQQARTILGKWKRDHGAGAVIEALAAAQRQGAIEPVSWIEARFRDHRRTEGYDPARITV